MTISASSVPLSGGAPPANVSVTGVPTTQVGTGVTVPADATAPVWQPWVNMQNNALSAFKTNITRQLAAYNANLTAAQRILDVAQSTAASQTKALETAAWNSFNKYMAEAGALYDSVMGPAVAAYIAATALAHTRLWEALTPAERAYAQVTADAQWSAGLSTGGAKLGPEAPIPGQ